MSVQDIINMVQNLGVSVVVIGASFWFIKYIFDNYNKQIETLTEAHKQETSKFTEALNNNTVALTQLTEKLDK